MSFCPTKDIHSVYLDNELPEVYKAQYEKHVNQCKKCQKELAKLKALRAVFQADSQQITPDKKFLDDSYQRLMIKMSYEKNSEKIKKPRYARITSIISAAAAAAVFAIVLPIGLKANKPAMSDGEIPISDILSMQPSLSPKFGNNISFGSGNNMAISGNIGDNMLSYDVCDCGDINILDDVDVKVVDVLRPQFDEDNIISIRITIPNVGDIPLNLENKSHEIVLSGNYLWNHLGN